MSIHIFLKMTALDGKGRVSTDLDGKGRVSGYYKA